MFSTKPILGFTVANSPRTRVALFDLFNLLEQDQRNFDAEAAIRQGRRSIRGLYSCGYYPREGLYFRFWPSLEEMLLRPEAERNTPTLRPEQLVDFVNKFTGDTT